MAKQLNLLSAGQVIPTALHAEMQQSYLEYAMSVIVGRALPDVRDGLKPVHRRILYAMHELGLTPDRPYRKCARVVGDVLGKYHPHGDQAVYDALVRMVQDFSSRYPLLAGHGNFGSVDNDPPAAMRYTETRLSAVGQESLLGEIGGATVDFIPNFDNSQEEPVVLPAQLPILLLNGCSGIAVGMATNIPPHNLGEVVDGLIALIDNPDLPDEKLFKLIPGPDFPTGGEIWDVEGIKTAYTTGRATIPVRGVTKIEEIEGKRGRHRRTAIVCTELPFQVNKAGWIEKLADLCTHSKIEGISDIRDESDRSGMRVVIELKREASASVVMEQLYTQTALQSSFGVILLGLVEGQPRQLTLRELLQEFLRFREQTLKRLYTHELQETEARLHLVEGLLQALNNLDRVISILRESADGSAAKVSFQNQLGLSETQADAILGMPMRRITSLEGEKLRQEHQELSDRRQELQDLLGSRDALLQAIKQHLRNLKRKYSDKRRTRILTPKKSAKLATTADKKLPQPERSSKPKPESASLPLLTPKPAAPEKVILEFTHRGYAKRYPIGVEAKPRSSSSKKVEVLDNSSGDFILERLTAQTDRLLVTFTRQGKAYPVTVAQIPNTTGTDAGKPLVSFLPAAVQKSADSITAQLLLEENLDGTDVLLMTKRGRIKRLAATDLPTSSGRGITCIKISDGDELWRADFTKLGEQVILCTSGGRLLRFEVNDEQLPLMSRAASPKPALRLGKQERLVGAEVVNAQAVAKSSEVLLVSELGYVKKMPLDTPRIANRGDIGTQSMQFSHHTDGVVGMVVAPRGSKVLLLTSEERLLSLPLDALTLWGKDGMGDRISQLHRQEKILSLSLAP
ncbi:MAG TPA: DNA topoisomerase 4 subunit A [Oscillatoriaceae cyanobacterium M33_DOE_052]|uniref:DNA topoisomerase (ATP-hydrolyzing) n=1 Tax=Planktothricoides sp. SpSt-374 TaxID=2282167 RepID=A0A7C3ZVB0_9CYAN|nr:DNA topoisomerase 4 subunit A [Oscillatoriaceae cyanobacterium M33_DOE_052]